MGDGDDILSIWISVADYGILTKECPVVLGQIIVIFLLEGYSYLEQFILMKSHGGCLIRGIQKL